MFTENDLYWKSRVSFWQAIAKKFADACEIDGFGGVKEADKKMLTIAYQEYTKEAVRGD